MLDGISFVPPHKLDYQAVEIFGARTDYYALGLHVHSAVEGYIPLNGGFKLLSARTGGFFQNSVAVFGQHTPHGLCQHRGRKFPEGGGKSGWSFILFGRIRQGKTVGLFENDKISAALFCLGIALVAKQLEGVLRRHRAHPRFLGDKPLGGQL